MNHPAGRIGKRLVLRVRDVMLSGAALPLCAPGTRIVEARRPSLAAIPQQGPAGPPPVSPGTAAQLCSAGLHAARACWVGTADCGD